jgi:hypothetical protein
MDPNRHFHFMGPGLKPEYSQYMDRHNMTIKCLFNLINNLDTQSITKAPLERNNFGATESLVVRALGQ